MTAQRTLRKLAALVAAATLAAPTIACAAGSGAQGRSGAPTASGVGAESSFGRFCGEWLAKLVVRENDNLAAARSRAGGSGVVLEYVGYSPRAVRCEARPMGPAGTYVGKMTYHELSYRRTGSNRIRAMASRPRVVHKIEVTEIFRFDGKRWRY